MKFSLVIDRISEEGFCKLVKGDVSLQYNTKVKGLLGDDKGNVSGVQLCRLEWGKSKSGMPAAREIEGTTQVLPIQMVLVSVGFTGPEAIVFEKFGVKRTPLGTIATAGGLFLAAEPRIFAAGDARRGSGMVEWAFEEGYDAALECAKYFTDNIKK